MPYRFGSIRNNFSENRNFFNLNKMCSPYREMCYTNYKRLNKIILTAYTGGFINNDSFYCY